MSKYPDASADDLRRFIAGQPDKLARARKHLTGEMAEFAEYIIPILEEQIRDAEEELSRRLT